MELNSSFRKTSLKGIIDLSAIVSPGNEKPLKKALYNGIALLLIVGCSIAAWGVFVILEPFLKPLFWALLCGSVLHPFKYMLASQFKKWIVSAESGSLKMPLVISIVSSPIKLLLDLSELVGDLFVKHLMKIVYALLMVLTTVFLYNYIPQFFICCSWRILQFKMYLLNLIVDVFQNKSVVATLFMAFLCSVTLFWTPQMKKHFLAASCFVWFAFSCFISGYFYYIRLPVFILFQLVFLAGIGCELWPYKQKLRKQSSRVAGEDTNPDERVSEVSSGPDVSSGDKENSKDITETDNETTKKDDDYESLRRWVLSNFWINSTDNTSDIYMYWVSVACVVTLILKSGWLPYFTALLFMIYAIQHACHYFGISVFIMKQYNNLVDWVHEWFITRKEVLLPAPVRGISMVGGALRVHILQYLRESSDSAASVMVILGLVIFVIFCTVFLTIQAYTEGLYMMQVGGSIINQTVVHNPELTQMLPEGWEHKLDSVLNNTYTYGRQGLSNLVRKMLSEVSEDKAVELEKRALELWDRIYQAWMMNALEQKSVGPKVTSSAVYQTWHHFLDGVQKTPELINMNTLNDILQNNMATLTSGLESLWELIKGNASLFMYAVTTVFSVVFSHGFAVLNFFISMIVFLTALFYLLSSSRTLYKPVEMITTMSPMFGSRLASAMERAVNEVLTASFKLSLFYGMWTWLIHNIFQMNITYIPAVLAAILAAVPALGTYWACLPAVLDLWLAQGKNMQALILAVCQFLPTTIVDATIYNDIHGGHPYLTGLSVAGGLFCLGMEGAIIGPLILCCLYVIINMSTSLMQDSVTPTRTLDRSFSSA